MVKWFLKQWLNWRVGWSNWLLHNIDGDLVDFPLQEEDHNCRTPKEYMKKAAQMLERFTYTYDKATQLFDAMRSPATCYADYVNGQLLDDCDGFHAALYHIADHNNLDCYLLTYMTEDVTKSHTILAVKYATKNWVAFDYDRALVSSTGPARLAEFAAHNHKTEVIKYNLVKYDYYKGYYYIVKDVE